MTMSPPPSLLIEVSPTRAIGLAKAMSELAAWRSPERATAPPAPLSVKGPLSWVEGPASRVRRPVWAMAQEEAPMREPAMEKLVPPRSIPPVMLRSPTMVVVPAPLDWVRAAAAMPRVEMLPACVNTRLPRGVVDPAAP